MIIIPFFNTLKNPKDLLCYLSIDDMGNTELINLKLNENTPFYNLKKVSVSFFEENILSDNTNVFFNVKEIYKVFGFKHSLNDANSLLWMHDLDVIKPNINYDIFDIPIQVKKYSSLYFEDYFDKLVDSKTNSNIDAVIKASSILDGHLKYDEDILYKYFDHYTKGGRLRDTESNSINIEAENRGRIASKGIKVYIDIDSFHLRILDRYLGINQIPKEVRGHDWVTEKAFGKYPPDNIKKKIFQALYSEKFYLVPCEFMDFVKLRYKQLKSPFNRKGRSFNDKVQEIDVLEMSNIILKLHKHGFSDILLYLYDGLLYDIKPSDLKNFLECCQEVINFPFKISINDKELRFN